MLFLLLAACGGSPIYDECDVPMALPPAECVDVGDSVTTTVDIPCPAGCVANNADHCEISLVPTFLATPGSHVFTVSPSSVEVPVGQTASVELTLTGVGTAGMAGGANAMVMRRVDNCPALNCIRYDGVQGVTVIGAPFQCP